MDDYENNKVKRDRGLGPTAFDERDGKRCEACRGLGGTYEKEPNKPNTHYFRICQVCNGEGIVRTAPGTND